MIGQLDRASCEATGLEETALATQGTPLLKRRDHIGTTGLPKEFLP
ncbi:hypothetical protein [Limimaricola sp.]